MVLAPNQEDKVFAHSVDMAFADLVDMVARVASDLVYQESLVVVVVSE